MIVAAYGVPWLSVLELTHVMEGLDHPYGVVNRQGLTKLNVDKPQMLVTPVVFASAGLVVNTQKRFKSRILALVVDQETVLERELGLVNMGPQALGRVQLKSIIRQSQRLTTPVLIERQPYSPVADVLSRFKQSSMSMLQTAIHKAKRVDPNTEVGKLVYGWLKSELSAERVRSKLQRLGPKGEDLCTLMATKEVKKLRMAVTAVAATGEAKIDVVARKHGVTPFDIRFVLRATK